MPFDQTLKHIQNFKFDTQNQTVNDLSNLNTELAELLRLYKILKSTIQNQENKENLIILINDLFLKCKQFRETFDHLRNLIITKVIMDLKKYTITTLMTKIISILILIKLLISSIIKGAKKKLLIPSQLINLVKIITDLTDDLTNNSSLLKLLGYNILIESNPENHLALQMFRYLKSVYIKCIDVIRISQNVTSLQFIIEILMNTIENSMIKMYCIPFFYTRESCLN